MSRVSGSSIHVVAAVRNVWNSRHRRSGRTWTRRLSAARRTLRNALQGPRARCRPGGASARHHGTPTFASYRVAITGMLLQKSQQILNIRIRSTADKDDRERTADGDTVAESSGRHRFEKTTRHAAHDRVPNVLQGRRLEVGDDADFWSTTRRQACAGLSPRPDQSFASTSSTSGRS